MGTLMIGGPLDGTVLDGSGPFPENLQLDLPGPVGGGVASYNLVEQAYRFAGWQEDGGDLPGAFLHPDRSDPTAATR